MDGKVAAATDESSSIGKRIAFNFQEIGWNHLLFTFCFWNKISFFFTFVVSSRQPLLRRNPPRCEEGELTKPASIGIANKAIAKHRIISISLGNDVSSSLYRRLRESVSKFIETYQIARFGAFSLLSSSFRTVRLYGFENQSFFIPRRLRLFFSFSIAVLRKLYCFAHDGRKNAIKTAIENQTYPLVVPPIYAPTSRVVLQYNQSINQSFFS